MWKKKAPPRRHGGGGGASPRGMWAGRRTTDLEDAAPLQLAGDVFAGLEHPQSHAVQQDDQHGHVLEPRGGGGAVKAEHTHV